MIERCLREGDLPDDLRPHVQRCVCLVPRVKRQCRPRLVSHGRYDTLLEMADSCTHIDVIDKVTGARHRACEARVKIGAQWVHLRTCQARGITLCCDSSPDTHASHHAQATSHPVIASAEPGEGWLYWSPHDQFTEY